MAASLRADPRWSSSGLSKCIYGSEFAGRLDFNQPTEGGITRSDVLPKGESLAPMRCLKSNALRHKEMDVYVIPAL